MLSLSDLPRVRPVVESVFDVVAAEDKIEEADDPATFGYMSHHYEALLSAGHTGPRYDDLKGLRFEVQVRTLLMDAWANVFHYLAYKGESSIPAALRRDFYALSGLFYVADKHFELFFDRSQQVQEEADRRIAESKDVELNLETLQAFLDLALADRPHLPRGAVAELADELLSFGYDTIGKLGEAMTKAKPVVDEYQAKMNVALTDVGFVRVAVRNLDSSFDAFLEEKYRSARWQQEAKRRADKG